MRRWSISKVAIHAKAARCRGIVHWTYLAAGALVFILPIITLILFYLIGRHLVSEPLAVLAAFVGLFAGTMVAGVIAKGKNGDRFKYKIKEITGRASPRLPFDSTAKGEADETIAKKNS